jgi:hypothetical protein
MRLDAADQKGGSDVEGGRQEENRLRGRLSRSHREGYAYGEPESPSLNSVMSFGVLGASEVTPENRSLWAMGYDAAVAIAADVEAVCLENLTPSGAIPSTGKRKAE